MVLNTSGAARAYVCLSSSFSRLERDTRRRGAFFLYWNTNAFTLYFESEGIVTAYAEPEILKNSSALSTVKP